MRQTIKLNTDNLKIIRKVNERMMSYNIEMAEVTGGTFWKEYTPEQITGKAKVPAVTIGKECFTTMREVMQYYSPADLRKKLLIKLAKRLWSAWVRVYGTWATGTYYDFDGITGGVPPAGYKNVLNKGQWIGVLEFVKAVGGKLMISVSNCEDDHPDGGELDLSQTEKIFKFSHDYGVDIEAAEFMNEPNMLEISGAPKVYGVEDYSRDQNIFYSWLRKNYPGCLIVGPCSMADPSVVGLEDRNFGATMRAFCRVCTTEELMKGAEIMPDVFSYHYYNGISERAGSVFPELHRTAEDALTDEYLAVASKYAKSYMALRDKYVPDGEMWVTESGDAAAGGSTWASTYLDVFRTLNELGSFSLVTNGVIFHNTLASSDYRFLRHGTFDPRPDYFAVLLWNELMGQTVYDCGDSDKECVHVYCHSRKDGKKGAVYLIMNNSLTETLTVEIPKEAERYTLSAETIRSAEILLNGKPLKISDTSGFPELEPVHQGAGRAELPPATCTFLAL